MHSLCPTNRTNKQIRANLHYDREVHRRWILGEFWNLIGWQWHSCVVVVYTTTKNPLVKNFIHGWEIDMATDVATLFWRGTLQRSSFFSNLKPLDKKLTWPLENPNLNNFFWSFSLLRHTIPNHVLGSYSWPTDALLYRRP